MTQQNTTPSASLYSIDDEIHDLLEMASNFDEATPVETVDEWLAQFEENKLARKDKVDNILKFVRGIEAWSAGIGSEIDRLQKLQAGGTRKVNNLLKYLENSMRNNEEKEMTTDLFKLKFVKNPPAYKYSDELLDELQKKYNMPELKKNYDEANTKFKDEKAELKEKVKNGEEVDGVVKTQAERLKIQ